jgi:outer membrane protein OmpA-like peptidoglycan-associated protein
MFLAKGPKINLKLEGVVYDKTTRVPIPHSIVILSRISNEDQIKLTDSSGRYKFDLTENMDFKLTAEKDGYLSDIENRTTKGLTTSQTIKQDFFLQNFQLNKAIRIENIYYDFDKYNIRPDAAVELNKLIKILKDNPTIKIELGSHTDSRGSDEYNMRLSQLRATSCVNYLITVGGIDRDRLTARGYGETQLLNRCSNGVKCSEAEHQLNRRTEFKIVAL